MADSIERAMVEVRVTGTIKLCPEDFEDADDSLRQAAQNALGATGFQVEEAEDA